MVGNIIRVLRARMTLLEVDEVGTQSVMWTDRVRRQQAPAVCSPA